MLGIDIMRFYMEERIRAWKKYKPEHKITIKAMEKTLKMFNRVFKPKQI